MPDGCDLVAAAALPVAYGTSHVALAYRAQLRQNQVQKHLLFIWNWQMTMLGC